MVHRRRNTGSPRIGVDTSRAGVVGTGRFELPTCRLGGDRSIQLSYVPACPSIVASQAFVPDVAAGSACRRNGSLRRAAYAAAMAAGKICAARR